MPLELPDAVRILATGVLVLGGSIWLGGFVTLILVSRSASATLPAADRVAFFRHFGRRFGSVSTAALVCALVAGAVLLSGQRWDGLSWSLLIAAIALLVAVAIGVVQARKMTRLRRRAVADPGNTAVVTRIGVGSRYAVWLRGTIGAISVLIFVLALLRAL